MKNQASQDSFQSQFAYIQRIHSLSSRERNLITRQKELCERENALIQIKIRAIKREKYAVFNLE